MADRQYRAGSAVGVGEQRTHIRSELVAEGTFLGQRLNQSSVQVITVQQHSLRSLGIKDPTTVALAHVDAIASPVTAGIRRPERSRWQPGRDVAHSNVARDLGQFELACHTRKVVGDNFAVCPRDHEDAVDDSGASWSIRVGRLDSLGGGVLMVTGVRIRDGRSHHPSAERSQLLTMTQNEREHKLRSTRRLNWKNTARAVSTRDSNEAQQCRVESVRLSSMRMRRWQGGPNRRDTQSRCNHSGL
jgi:hypothetical protein